MTSPANVASALGAFPTVVHEWPFHDHEHLRQILDITKAVYLPSMSETMRTALQDSND